MSIAKVIEIIGSSPKGWQDAAHNALAMAEDSLRGITGIEVAGQNASVKDGKIVEYRTVLRVAFQYEAD